MANLNNIVFFIIFVIIYYRTVTSTDEVQTLEGYVAKSVIFGKYDCPSSYRRIGYICLENTNNLFLPKDEKILSKIKT